MYKQIIIILIQCLVQVLNLFICDEVDKNEKDPEGFPLSDDYDKFSFFVSILENVEQILRGRLSIDEFIEMSKGA